MSPITEPQSNPDILAALAKLAGFAKTLKFPFPMVVDQIAFLVSADALPNVQLFMGGLGHSDWATDRNVAQGTVFGQQTQVQGVLNFSYSYVNVKPGMTSKGVEFELLTYDAPTQTNTDWHSARAAATGVPLPPCKLSHLGFHVPNVELVKQHLVTEGGLVIAQEVLTESHTNPFLVAEGRKYHYLILDTEAILGYDLKFIQRIQ
jgi:hypothetical protein